MAFQTLGNLLLLKSRQTLTSPDALGLITCSRAALSVWEGVKDIQWSFLSPPPKAERCTDQFEANSSGHGAKVPLFLHYRHEDFEQW